MVMLNGLLSMCYFCWDHGPTLLSLALAALVAAWPDRAVQRVVGHRARRYGRGEMVRASPVGQIATAVVALLWAGASFLSCAPVTWWGVVMWAVLLCGALALPQEREDVLWTHKGLIAGYAALAVGLRLLFQSPVDTAGWSELMGVEQGGIEMLAMVRQALAPWMVITVWAIYPAACLGFVGQRLFVNRARLVSPLASVRQVIEDLRTRGE